MPLEVTFMVNGKVVLITGAASGLGLTIGLTFLKNDAKVVFTDKNMEKVHEVARDFQQHGFDCYGFPCDVTKEEDIQRVISQTIEVYGTVDILINNAGLQHIALVEDFPTDIFEEMIQVMLLAPFMTMKHVLPMMKKQQFGRIINVASINGLIGFSGKAAYNSAKHGVIGLTKVAALETAESGITVNALCPGYIDTPLVRGQLAELAKNRNTTIEKVLTKVIYPFIPQRRLLQTKEVADYALFLASEATKSVTGQAVVIDGGYTAQ